MLTTMPLVAPPAASTRVEPGPDAGPAPDRDSRPAAGLEGQPARRGGRLRVLDGLRLFAALAVVGWHLTAAPTAGWAGLPFGALTAATRYGWLGVELFFLISGFVICMSGWGRSVGDFAASRVARLYPAYWFAVLLAAVVLTAATARGVGGSDEHAVTLSQLAANLTMLQNPLGVADIDPSYWTLAVELRFYLLFAIVLAIGVTYRRVVYFCVVWLAVSVFVSGQPWLAWLISAENVPYFVAGMALFLIHRFGATPLLWAIVTVSWLLALYRLDSHLGATLHDHSAPTWLPAAAAVTGCFGVMILVATGRLDRVDWPWLVTAGALTYPLYLVHQSLGVTVISRLHGVLPAWLLLAGLIGALLGLAWLIHRFVERPLAARMKRASAVSLAALRRPALAPPRR
jgi:peptidoglycan/LPS O-acetylase OafA/YrhL